MKKVFLFFITIIFIVSATNAQTNSQPTVTIENLKQILDAFNRHDLNAIMEVFADDCSFDFPGVPEFCGQRFIRKV